MSQQELPVCTWLAARLPATPAEDSGLGLCESTVHASSWEPSICCTSSHCGQYLLFQRERRRLLPPVALHLMNTCLLQAAPSERPESAGEASVVLESPPGPSLQASPSAEDRPAPRRARRRTLQHHTAATGPQLLAIHRRQLEVAEQLLRVEQRRLHLQERALAWRQEAWGAYMETFNRLVDYLAPRAAPSAAVPALPAPPTVPPTAPLIAAPSTVAPPPATEGRTAKGDLGPAETRRMYLPVRPAPSQPRTGLWPRRGSRLPTPSAGL
ncbi:uncharacterized protein LOC142001278 isoform X2 [Carettochelys insculpta]|uniref:uncharacterized protein LOC142001278 isoform X2 n=1 Tax=Carettochelys insculpta TaxID=44489 RepID=UPI003EB7CCEB